MRLYLKERVFCLEYYTHYDDALAALEKAKTRRREFKKFQLTAPTPAQHLTWLRQKA